MNAGEKTLDWLFREQLKIDKAWAVRNRNGFTWWPDQHAQTIEIIERDEDPDGDTGYRVRVQTACVRNLMLTDENLTKINNAVMPTASMAGLVYDEHSRTLKLSSLVRIYEHIRPWMQTLVSMACVLQIAEAHVAGPALARALSAESDATPHPSSGARTVADELASVVKSVVVPMGEQPCRWTEEEFEDAVERYMQQPPTLLATAGGLGFTAEFIHGEDSSVCRVSCDSPHPVYGNGLSLMQSFPIGKCSAAEGGRAAMVLNRAELTQEPFGYGFGSYSFRDGMIHFKCFIPNVAYRKGLIPNLFFTCASRAKEMSRRLKKTEWTAETFERAFQRRLAVWKSFTEAFQADD